MSDTAAFAHLRKLPSEELHRWEQHLSSLVGHPGWEIVTRLLAQQQQNQLEQMIAAVRDQADYAFLAGTARGIKRAADCPSTVVELAQKELAARQRSAEAEEERNR